MISTAHLDELVDRALAEDLGGGDVTTAATVREDVVARGMAVAREELIVCGGRLFARVFQRLDPAVRVESRLADGSAAVPGSVLWTVEGRARSILGAERTALNFVQRLCGIATLARRYVDAVPAGSRTRITDTRKTTPGLRSIERYAVRTGGAHNHRNALDSSVLIKDNHVAAAGGVRRAVEAARRAAPHTAKIEVEVEGMDELDEALDAGADIVMLDNFEAESVERAVERVAGRAMIEVSGGVTLERVAGLASAGADAISVGALTHYAPAADIGLDVERAP